MEQTQQNRPEGSSPQLAAKPSRLRTSLFLTMGTNIAIMGLTVATGTLNARLLGPSGRGELAAIQTIPNLLGALVLLGLPSAVAYFSAQRPRDARTFAVTATGVSLGVSLPAILVGYFLMPSALHQQSATVVHDARIYLIYVALQSAQYPYYALQGMGGFGIWNVLRLAPYLASLAAIVLATGTGHRTSGAFTQVFLVFYAVIGPIAFAILWRRSSAPETPRRPLRQTARELLRYSLPGALMLPAGLLNLQLDQIMMAAWLPSQVLGLYAVSVSWSGLISPAFGALGSIVLPTLAAARDHETRRAVAARSTRLAVLVVIVLGLGLALCTPLLLPLMFGRQFAPAVPASLILVAASMVLNLNGLCGEILRGLGAPRWPLFSQLAGLPVTVALLVLLLPRWSIVGAGVSSLVAYAVMSVVSFRGVSKVGGLTIRELLLPRAEDYRTLIGAVRDVLRRFALLRT